MFPNNLLSFNIYYKEKQNQSIQYTVHVSKVANETKFKTHIESSKKRTEDTRGIAKTKVDTHVRNKII